MELHLDEATFLWTQWENAHWAPDYALPEVEAGDERRLLAHLDALVLGGRSVATRLLLPALQGEEPGALCAAAWALLSAEDADWLEAFGKQLTGGPSEQVAPLLRAWELSGRADAGDALRKLLPSLPPAGQVRVLAALRFRGMDPGPALAGLALEADEGLRAEAMRAARWLPRSTAAALLRRGLADPAPAVREASLWTGLVLGMKEAWSECRRLFEAGPTAPRIALLALAVSGDRRDLQLLLSRLEERPLWEELLWALGFSGVLEAADAAFRAIVEGGGRPAAESFAAMTGMPLDPPFVLDAELREESDDPDKPPALPEVPGAVVLPGPASLPGQVQPEVVAHWWQATRAGLDPRGRYLRGNPWSPGGLLSELESGPMRRRPALLVELEMRTGGRVRVEPRTWVAEQRRLLAPVSQLVASTFTGSFERFFS